MKILDRNSGGMIVFYNKTQHTIGAIIQVTKVNQMINLHAHFQV